ncbi:hypothetical protein [Paenibacillus taiwanensis]|uniref:hypothetical protein n=1 Tax=Paenibacillus taiwanensis TaxID=401638 RepID=UPI00040A172E|nr:hypothetical protein [Paenibacillus taiwanensis]
MLHSNSRISEIPFSRMESAILYLVRGMLSRRQHSNEQEAVVFESHMRSLLHIITELHRFQDRRNSGMQPEQLRDEPNVQSKQIISEIINSTQLIRESMNENPFDNLVHMDLMNVKLDIIVKYHTESQTYSFNSSEELQITPSIQDEVTASEVVTVYQHTNVVEVESETIETDDNLPQPEVSLLYSPPQQATTFIKKQPNKKSQASPLQLPPVTSFIKAKVGSMIYEQK